MATLSFHRLKMGKVEIVCLFVLMLNVTVNNFSVMSGGSHCFLGITSASFKLAQMPLTLASRCKLCFSTA